VKTEIPPTPGVLLAGGLARRMGGGDATRLRASLSLRARFRIEGAGGP